MSNLKSHMFLNLTWRPVLWVLVIVVLLGCVGSIYLYATIFAVDAASLEQGQVRAYELLMALQRYEHNNDRFPSTVEELVPEYLEAIPRPARRYPYTYTACSGGGGYILYFRLAGSNDTWCGYSSSTTEWQCTDSIPPYYYDCLQP